ncbi:MAG TPA: glycosyltransferase family 2 protein, partial [Syntrophorhabdus aromaticivorans]|nr:glycosyltransferase family 2 protein [Syntrophorhabdus aromaticivorans]
MITIIIPSYNSQGTIRGCLDSVLNQSYGDRYEVILVDSSSD